MCSLNRECVCCEKNCKSMFAKVCCALNDNLMYYIHNNHPFFIIERWDEFFIKKIALLEQTIFMFFWDYALHNGKSVSLGNRCV